MPKNVYRYFLLLIIKCTILTGKAFKPKAEPKKKMTEDEAKEDTEWDDLLKEASEEELVDLAGKTCVFILLVLITRNEP